MKLHHYEMNLMNGRIKVFRSFGCGLSGLILINPYYD